MESSGWSVLGDAILEVLVIGEPIKWSSSKKEEFKSSKSGDRTDLAENDGGWVLPGSLAETRAH